MSLDFRQLLLDILEDRVTARAAAEVLHHAGPGMAGIALEPSSFTAEQLAKLDQAFAAIRWEGAKLAAPGRLPDVEYGSPAYLAWEATIPTSSPDDPDSF